MPRLGVERYADTHAWNGNAGKSTSCNGLSARVELLLLEVVPKPETRRNAAAVGRFGESFKDGYDGREGCAVS